MRIQLRCKGIDLSTRARDQIRRSARLRIGRFAEQVVTLRVHASDINGPRGGVDIRCVLVAETRDHGAVVIEHTGENLGEALNLALDRLRRTLDRARLRALRRTIRSSRTAAIAPAR